MVDEAIREDNYDVAKKIGRQAIRFAKERELLQRVVVKNREVKAAAKAYANAKEAMTTLKEKPDDPDANLTVGKHLCFSNGDWEKGLPMLVLGSDEKLVALAEKDIAGAASANEQAKLGDTWWEVSEEEEGATRKQIQARAAYWYKQALPGMSGLKKDMVENRLWDVMQAATEERWQPKFVFKNAKRIADYVRLESVRLESDAKIVTAAPWEGPFDVTLIARTNSTNIRIYFGAAEYAGVIFNWEVNPAELRLIRLHDRSIAAIPVTPLKKNVWYKLRWIVARNGTSVMVNDKLVFSEKQNNSFLQVQPIIIRCAASTVDVKSVRIVQPK